MRDALAHLYDLAYLRTHPLALLLRPPPVGYAAPTAPAKALRQRLLEAIDALRPASAEVSEPVRVKAERRHRLFALRYVDGLPVAAVRARLAIGESEYHRQHRQGLAVVAALLREHCSPREQGNLPTHVTSFVGRGTELRRLQGMLADARLVTLTGTGGCGKTRLALQAAAGLGARFPDGVWLADLARIVDEALVLGAVAAAVGVRDVPEPALLEAVLRSLRPKRLLLILDNCEHVLDACARLADAVLKGCPDVRLLVTSRQCLGIGGEVIWRVPSLSVPPGTGGTAPSPADRLLSYDAVRLFVDRAAAVCGEFRLNDHNGAAVAAICRHLDGIPLAIELAAARMRALSARQVAARLDDRFGLLTGGSRTALPRHRTLRAAVDWSYDLLDPLERTLFARLAVFAGGFTLEAAEAVCAGDDGGRNATDGPVAAGGSSSFALRSPDVLDLLAQLVDKSLVLAEPAGDEGDVRYRLLETVRQYARERLAASGDEAPVGRRHARFYLALAERAAQDLRGPQQGVWFARLDAESPDLRQALRWCQEQGETERGLRLAAALWRFWRVRGYVAEGRRSLATFLVLPAAAPRPAVTAARVEALNGAGALACAQGDHAAARALHQQALAGAGERGDRQGVASALHGLGSVAEARGDFEAARALHGQSLAISRELGDRWGVAESTGDLGFVVHQQGDFEAACALFRERLRRARELGDRQLVAWSLVNLGWTLLDRGDYAAARARYAESLAINQTLSNLDSRGLAATLGSLGYLALVERDHPEARARFDESLAAYGNVGASNSLARLGRIWLALQEADEASARLHLADGLREAQASGNDARLGRVLAGYAAAATAWGRPEPALRLAGWVRSRRPDPLSPFLQRLLDRYLTPARQALPEAAQAAAWAQGQALSPAQAVADALAAAPGSV